MKGYKATDADLCCTPDGSKFQFQIGTWYEIDGEIELCARGFHFCEQPSGVWAYYNQPGTRVFKVEAEEVLDTPREPGADFKRCCRRIRLVEEIKIDGARNTGNQNTGYQNTGARNTGDWNTGDWNTGDWNTGYRNTGFFNTETPKEILVFGKMCKREEWDKAYKPSWLYFNLTEWIDFSDMTDEEKTQNESAKTTGGYLKKLDYKKAFKKSYDNASLADQLAVKKLPNFNRKMFLEISGIDIK